MAEETRQQAYERKRKELTSQCFKCQKQSHFPPSFEKCNYEIVQLEKGYIC